MKKRAILASLCASVALVGMAPVAHAQLWGGSYYDDEDSNFNGIIAGGQLGWEGDQLTLTSTEDGVDPQTASSNKFSYGLYAGYDLQFSQGVIGAEVLLNPNAPGSGSFTYMRDHDDDDMTDMVTDTTAYDKRLRLDATARAGFVVMPSLLVYARGGYGWQRMRITNTAGEEGASATTVNGTARGFIAGGGAEYVLFPGVNLRIDYRYNDLNLTGVDTEAPDENAARFDGRTHVITGGVALRF